MKERLASIYVCAEVCLKEQGKSVKGTDRSELHSVGPRLCQNPNETSQVQSDVAFEPPFAGAHPQNPRDSPTSSWHHTQHCPRHKWVNLWTPVRESVHVRAANTLKAAIVLHVLYRLWFDWKGATPDHKAHFNLNLLQIVPWLFNVH